MNQAKWAVALGAALAGGFGGCASSPTKPINLPSDGKPPVEAALGVDGDALVLAFSGGGARAASFSYGALLGLRDMPSRQGGSLLDRVVMVSAVSGGAVTAAYYGRHGAAGLDRFRQDVLDKDWSARLMSTWSPTSWANLVSGGINGQDRLADWLDDQAFKGAVLRDLRARPRIIINATELYTGAPFAFASPWFEAICSNLDDVRLADAVAASMAVPLGFRPIDLRSYGEACAFPPAVWVEKDAGDHAATALLQTTARAFKMFRDPAQMRYLRLVDGGVVDNFGLSSLSVLRRAGPAPTAPLSPEDAVRLRRLVVLVVNAEKSIEGPSPLSPREPGAVGVVGAAFDDVVNAAKRNAYDAFAGALEAWRREIVEWRCSLTPEAAVRLGASANWVCRDVDFKLDMISFSDLPPSERDELGAAPTRVSLPSKLIDDLIAGGREAIGASQALQGFLARPSPAGPTRR